MSKHTGLPVSREHLEEMVDRLELKEQELEDCRIIMRRTEAEKTMFQNKVSGLFNQV